MLDSEDKLVRLIGIFNDSFLESENTILQRGAKEPFYQAAKDKRPAIIYFTEDYFSSALHEISHWCIAGKRRRAMDDFGYWYRADGRSQEEQVEFEQVEMKPQSIEWLFSLACEHRFHFSVDNLTQGIDASEEFKNKVLNQLMRYIDNITLNLPPRAAFLYKALTLSFRNGLPVDLPLENRNV